MSVQIISIILSAAAALIGGLVLSNLRTLSQQIRAQNSRIDAVESDIREFAGRKDKCRQDFVDKVDYIREVTKIGHLQTKQLEVLSELKGSMAVLEQMPKICGNIAAQTVKQMQKETANNV
ncbi:MAG TPA: hypothetical protein VJ904_05635 [Tichowtungia sp.]|nr:hypothetical protein [Tichowtungia sp.]